MAGLSDDARGSLKPLLLGIVLMATAGGCSEEDRPDPEKRLGKPRVMRIVTPGAAGGRTLVKALATNGEQVYVGGDFEFLGRLTGKFLRFSRAGTPRPSATQVAGPGGVAAIAPDGSGGWFIGGTFTAVKGIQCPRLAHIRRNQSLDRRFCRRPSDAVTALARHGATLYIGGQFTRIGRTPRLRLAALDARTGSLRSWNPGVAGVAVPDTMVPVGPGVRAIVASSSAIFVGGAFQRIGGASRRNLGALHPRTGEALAWQVSIGPERRGDPYIYSVVTTLARSGSRLYLGGEFGRVAGQPRPGVAAVDADSGRLESWRPSSLPSYVTAIAPAGRKVYVAAFDFGIDSPAGVFALDRRTGRRVAWIRSTGSPWMVETLTLSGSTLYLGGEFSRIGGQPRVNLASVDIRTDRLLSWAPTLDGPVVAVAAAKGTLAVGGDFSAESESVRRDLAALDAETGEVRPLRVELKGVGPNVDVITVRDSTLLLAGFFDGVASEKRSDLAAVDFESGEPTSWNPSIEKLNLGLGLLSELDGTIYVAGGEPAGSSDEPSVQAVDAESGASRLSPDVKSFGYSTTTTGLAATKSRLYIAGHFGTVNGVRRRSLAAVDESGNVLPWNPRPNGDVTALTVVDETLYVGGDFMQVAGLRRYGAAAFNAETGQLLEWAPLLGPGRAEARAFGSFGSAVFIAGNFTTVAGVRHAGLTAVDRLTGRPLRWKVDIGLEPGDEGVTDLVVAGSTLYLAGEFATVNRFFQPNLAAVRLSESP